MTTGTIDDLPRLSDEARALDDGPASAPPRFPRLAAFLSRWHARRLKRAEQYLAACQSASERYPGLYDELVRDAEQALARLQTEAPSLQG